MCHTGWVRPHLATLLEDFRRRGAGRAIVHHTGNRSLPATYAELVRYSARFAAELHRRGIAPGERVLLWGQNSAAWVAAFYGAMLRGILIVPLDAAGDPAFAHRVIADTTPRLILGDPALLARLAPSSTPQLALSIAAGQLPPPEPEPIRSLDRGTPLQIIFTSGTTSEPKGIVHTHGNVLASLDPIEREIARYRRYERPFHPLRFLHTLPLSHVFGQFMGLWVPPLLAAEVHLETRLDAPGLAQLIRTHRISVLAAVPRVLELLRTHLVQLDPALPARLEAAQHLSALHRWWRFRRQHRLLGLKFWACVCGGATLPQELEEFWTGLGFALIQGYGMTETTALVTLNHPFHIARGSIGRPLAGREVQVAEDGEILVRGDSVAATEWRHGAMQSRSDGASSGDWLRTGDLAARNSTGELIFTGRKSDVIVTSAGLNIYPQDLEAALERQPGIRSACVFAWNNRSSSAGPQPAAALLAAPGANLEGAVEAANSALADYQQIRRWLLWPEPDLPRTSTGKVRRGEVAARAATLFSPGGASTTPAGQDALVRALHQLNPQHAAPISDATRLREDLNLDSLSMVELQSTLEQRFSTEIPEDAWQQVRTVAHLRQLLGFQPPAATAPPATGIAPTSPPPARSRQLHDATVYPRWPWTAPVRWLRIAFQEVVVIPLTRILLGPRIERPANLDTASPMILVANHVTALDVPIVLTALPAKMRHATAVAMAAGLLMGWRHARTERHALMRPLAPLAYWLVTALFNTFPLPQGAGFRRSFAHAGAALDRGMHVLIFPEGRRSSDGSIAAFQPGIGLLARDAGVPVLPVSIFGLSELKQRRRRWFRPGTVTIHVGSALHMHAEETPQQFTMRLEAAMRQLATAASPRPSQSR
jgi:long-chain acyl-CoA synthetase